MEVEVVITRWIFGNKCCPSRGTKYFCKKHADAGVMDRRQFGRFLRNLRRKRGRKRNERNRSKATQK